MWGVKTRALQLKDGGIEVQSGTIETRVWECPHQTIPWIQLTMGWGSSLDTAGRCISIGFLRG